MKEIKYKDYYDKVKARWIGKCIGGSVGAAMENNKYLMDLDISEIFPKEIPANDDLDIQILWLQVIEETGIFFTEYDLAKAWEKCCWYPFNEYGYFIHNFRRKIDPPTSGWYNNQFFCKSMGSPIRSEIWGMISVGDPETAKRYAYKDSILDHSVSESLWAEQMLSAMESIAFLEKDIMVLVEYGIDQLPDKSKLKKCIYFIRSEYY